MTSPGPHKTLKNRIRRKISNAPELMEKVLVDDDISLYELGLPIRDGAIKKSIIALPSNALSAEGIRTKADKGIATIDAIRIANLLSGVKDTSDTGL